ncbi:hypothetical protein [Streptomyces phaeochromogenes]
MATGVIVFGGRPAGVVAPTVMGVPADALCSSLQAAFAEPSSLIEKELS